MITKFFKLFQKKDKQPEYLPKIDGFYIDKNTIGEQSQTGWSTFIRGVNGELIKIERPKFPPDRIEIH